MRDIQVVSQRLLAFHHRAEANWLAFYVASAAETRLVRQLRGWMELVRRRFVALVEGKSQLIGVPHLLDHLVGHAEAVSFVL